MAMTNEQLTKWIDEIFGTIDEIKQNSGDITGLTRSVKQLRDDLTATQEDVSDLEDQTAGVVSLPKAPLQHFTDGSATQALDLIADIIPVQAGTGDPSPTNVRAITGFSSVTANTHAANYLNTATISLGSTVYGGTVGFTTGELYVDKLLVDLSDLTYNYESSGIAHPFFSAAVSGMKAASSGISNIYINSAVTTQNDTDYAFAVTADATPKLRIRHSDYTDATEFKAYLATAGAVAVVELATPITTTLTPAQLTLLQGENNVSATSGPITLTYAPDNVLAEVYAYIQKRFDTLTASLAANRTTRKTTKTLTKKED